jgi:predicted GH43/DUF377 family glycosyl hydrolase
MNRVLKLSDGEVESLLGDVLQEFGERHRSVESMLEAHFREVSYLLPTGYTPTPGRRLFIGSYFTCEYSIEAAALFNPSIVPHPDQDGLPVGSLRFIMSLRAVGEGHISSIEFRTGVINKKGEMTIDDISRYASTPHIVSNSSSEYEVRFPDETPISERVLFPISEVERNGMEDARFVKFQNDDGEVTYYATYTAYDGRKIIPRLLETKDFVSFRSRALSGQGVENKGMALFPGKIENRYAMISRQDGENLFLMFSDDVSRWDQKIELLKPTSAWELIQIGNCGSPIETEKGWLLLTHGVGPMRRYCIGAVLLDLKDPSKVIGRLEQPLLVPNESEREGYVPNVVYTCGAILHSGDVILPYAASDHITTVASISLSELLKVMV